MYNKPFSFIWTGGAKVCGKFLKADEIETEFITREIQDGNVVAATERNFPVNAINIEKLRGEKNKVFLYLYSSYHFYIVHAG